MSRQQSLTRSKHEEPQLAFKVVVVGESGVGKTNILSRYVNNKFFVGQNTTIGIEFSSKIIQIEGQKIKVQLWDTAGQQRYRALAGAFYKNAVGALIVFDLGTKETFTRLAKWVEQIRQQASSNLTMMLVGNKSDLEKRQITTEQAIQFSQNHNMAYMETSACTGHNVQNAFTKLFEEIYTQYKGMQKPEIKPQEKPVPINRQTLLENRNKQKKKGNSCCDL